MNQAAVPGRRWTMIKPHLKGWYKIPYTFLTEGLLITTCAITHRPSAPEHRHVGAGRAHPGCHTEHSDIREEEG